MAASRLRWPIIAGIGSVILVLAAPILLVDKIPPRSMSVGAVVSIAIRILMFARANDHLPPDLSVLPVREGHSNRITDGWGQEIIYQVRPDGIVVLTCYGKDRRAGGFGEDADFIGIFNPRGPDGKWRTELEWIHDPSEDFYASYHSPKKDK